MTIIVVRTFVTLGFAYTLFLLWMAAGIAGLIGLALMVYGGLTMTDSGTRALDNWPALRRLLRRRD